MSHEKIMVVDDDQEFLEELKETLSLSGYHPIIVQDSSRAQYVAQRAKLSAILLDLMMDRMDGYEVADRLRHQPETAGVPIIAMTGYPYPDTQTRLRRETGIRTCLKKPFYPLDVIAQIEKAIADVEHEKFIDHLEIAVCAEEAMTAYFNYLASLIKNGTIQNRCHLFAERAHKNYHKLASLLETFGVSYKAAEEHHLKEMINPEDFSLMGAIDRGIELTGWTIEIYKDLIHHAKGKGDKLFFKELHNEKVFERRFLSREKKYQQYLNVNIFTFLLI